MTLGLAAVFRLAALVLFIIAAVFGIFADEDLVVLLVLIAVGLASWVASTLVP